MKRVNLGPFLRACLVVMAATAMSLRASPALAQGAPSCPPSDDLAGSSQTASFKGIIASRYQKDGKSPDGVPVSIHFSDFKIGSKHSYRRMVNNPDGPGGVEGGEVFPVKASYLVCEDYPGFAATGYKGELLKTEYEKMTYSCFKDDTGDWVCNQSGGNQGMPQHLPK